MTNSGTIVEELRIGTGKGKGKKVLTITFSSESWEKINPKKIDKRWRKNIKGKAIYQILKKCNCNYPSYANISITTDGIVVIETAYITIVSGVTLEKFFIKKEGTPVGRTAPKRNIIRTKQGHYPYT